MKALASIAAVGFCWATLGVAAPIAHANANTLGNSVSEYPGHGGPGHGGPGYPHPGPGYPHPGPGYPHPGPGYPHPGPGYPHPGYPHPGYPYPQPGYCNQVRYEWVQVGYGYQCWMTQSRWAPQLGQCEWNRAYQVSDSYCR